MSEKNRYGRFPESIKKKVKEEQQSVCAYCGREGCLEVHHIIPKSIAKQYGLTRQETHSRENAVGLCADGCHRYFDNLALKQEIFFDEVCMEEGIEYHLPRQIRKKVDHKKNRKN
jgi:hypothetical protein